MRTLVLFLAIFALLAAAPVFAQEAEAIDEATVIAALSAQSSNANR